MKKEDIKKENLELDELDPTISEEEDKKVVEEEDDEKVFVSKKELENLFKRVETLETGNKEEDDEQEEENNKTVLVRFFDDQIVIGYGLTYEKKGADGRKYLMLEVITKDKKIHEVEYLPFMNQGKQEKAEILKVEKKFKEIKDGKVSVTKTDYKNYSSYKTGAEVSNVIMIPEHLYTIKLSNGDTEVLSEEALN